MDVSKSLARQSVIVAGAAALVDATVLGFCGVFTVAPWHTAAVLVCLAAADLALAAPPRTAGVVALAHVLVRLLATLLLLRHGFGASFADVGFLVAGYRAGAWLAGPKSVLTMLALCAGVAASHLLARGHDSYGWLFLLAGTVSAGCVPWLVGRYTAARGAYIADLEQHAKLRQQEHRVALERVVTEERAAIARDLHDVISHHVSAIGIHAGAARMALAGSTNAAATRSLTAVESSSRAAMEDLRRQLDLLHGRDDESQRQPGLADVDRLVEHVREAGLAVEVVVRGPVVALPESLNITLYRIVQEMLTNALRHGDGVHARLEVTYGPKRVSILATNPLPPTPPAPGTSAPRGLGGMRRRAELFDATLRYGPDQDGTRWRTEVTVPIGGA